jgi:serine phosphatase RsbU (regulator of sigma subunit)
MLQLNDPAVSRDHAVFSFRPSQEGRGEVEGEWLLEDLGSTHGTWLNGVRLKPNRQYHLRAKDLVVIGPWTFLVADRSAVSRPGTTLPTVNDAALVGTFVSRCKASSEGVIATQGLRLLQECSERIHAARTEAEIVTAVLEVAVAGTEFSRAAVLRPMTDQEEIEVVASKEDGPSSAESKSLSRGLIREAAAGSPARLERGPSGEQAGPIGSEHLRVIALCIPLMVESTLLGFVYLDRLAHDAEPEDSPEGAVNFCLALARLAAMGMANLMRVDIEKRQVWMEAKLRAAAEAQQWLLPRREGQVGSFKYVGETRQGRYVGGDFFDIIPLENKRLAVVVGDVRGKGVPVSVLVSASQGFIHASLLEHEDPALTVTLINRFYRARISHSTTLRLWVGLFDVKQSAVAYIDAGLRGAMTVLPGGECRLLPAGETAPVGIEPGGECSVQTAPLSPGGRILIVTDGFIEQRAGAAHGEESDDPQAPDDEETRPRFGLGGIRGCIHGLSAEADEVAELFSALAQHAGTDILDDDATAVMISW